MRKNRLLIVVFTSVAVILSFISCMDYFEDETNYLVFVPEVLDKTVSDCRVMVYDETGTLVGSRYASSPWDNDPRMAIGQFCFRLPPGEYKVYCYTNTDSLSFVDFESLETSAFKLKESVWAALGYAQPSDVFYQKLTPRIIQPGYLYTDTVRTERYAGRITVRFEDFPGDVSRIDRVQLQAEGAPTLQYLKDDTLTTRLTPADVMFHLDKLPVQQTPGILEVDHRYLPSIEGEYLRLVFTFLDAAGMVINRLPVEVVERETRVPLRLLHGQRLIINIKSYTVTGMAVVGWDEDIWNSDTDME